MLHRGSSLYKAQRNDDLLKYKPHQDAEATVIGPLPGKGSMPMRWAPCWLKYRRPTAARPFTSKLGTGFTEVQRQNPLPIGSTVTFWFRGLNDSGLPRFASFMRLREDQPARSGGPKGRTACYFLTQSA
jgi:DNA ligase-1